VIEIAPELTVWQQVRTGIHLDGVCIRTRREDTGECAYRQAWRQFLHGKHCRAMQTCS
jgi:hypothetical protein